MASAFALTVLRLGVSLALFAYVLPQLVLRPAWPAILRLFGDSPAATLIVGQLLVHAAVFVAVNGMYAVLYAGYVPQLDRYRVIPKPWPWQRDEATRAAFWASVRSAITAIAFNNLALGLPLAWLTYRGPRTLAEAGGGGYGDVSLATFPSVATMAWQLVACVVVEDTLFYWSHRLLHTPWLYRHVHKTHHAWWHTISLAAEHAHPVEWALGNALPFIAGPQLVGAHTAFLYVWMVLRIASTLDGHSGYCFPWSLVRLWPPSGEEHDAHHSVNVGNFGSSLPVWDAVCGTGIAHSRVVAAKLREPRVGDTAVAPGGDGGDSDEAHAAKQAEPADERAPGSERRVHSGDGRSSSGGGARRRVGAAS